MDSPFPHGAKILQGYGDMPTENPSPPPPLTGQTPGMGDTGSTYINGPEPTYRAVFWTAPLEHTLLDQRLT